ncbi:uncharacterized protein LOC125955559 [Anopheles darlingi]|uniref:uncharacterized protein LOC125955559 n=1 Tax=Anopheles darlingi TaxID=43151 RepID=UPI00210065C0|nr:uncharacterized protein LOC125955559 [Anopheles darlingi]
MVRWVQERAFKIVLTLSLSWCYGVSQVRGAENLLTSFEIRHGYTYPSSVTVAEGELIHLRLLVAMQTGDRCLYREPGSAKDIDVHGEEQRMQLLPDAENNATVINDPYVNGNECGIRVSPIQQRDAGFWRLTLVRGQERIRGVTMVDVIERPVLPEVSDGSVGSLEDISPHRTEYCYVERLDGASEGLNVPMHERCSVPLKETDPTGAGMWRVVAGVQGQMREISYGIHIENKEEQIVPSVHKEPDYHVLSCHLRYTRLMLKFCRFIRLADNLGLNVMPGLGTTRYGYTGAGFERNECGLEIHEPDGLDKGLWKCVLGYGDAELTKVSGAILDNSDTVLPIAIIEREATVTAQNGTLTMLQCNVNKPIDYCWFRGPHGQFYSLSEALAPEGNTGHWYSGISLAMGDCGITLESISDLEHAGLWHCYAGNGRISAVEVSTTFTVRISASQMISVANKVEVRTGFSALLGCDSIPKGTPLQYCRFVTPTGEAFSLNENVTNERPILERYYTNPNHDLAKGSCSLVIASVQENDVGEWICAGKIEGHPTEHIATVELVDTQDNTTQEGESRSTLSAASISGMVIGSIAIVITAFGVGWWRYRRRLHEEATAVNQELQMRSFDSLGTSPDLGHMMGRLQIGETISVISSDSSGSSRASHQSFRLAH